MKNEVIYEIFTNIKKIIQPNVWFAGATYLFKLTISLDFYYEFVNNCSD